MTIKRNKDLSEIYISQTCLAQRIITNFLPDDYPAATSPASSHLFNHVSEDKPYDSTLPNLPYLIESNICQSSCQSCI